ncbi:MAG TPA: ABC transporter permease [Streptosporangiaceae bacterium]|jgi:peptide/nickel transport system permease protein|nr:ABC transporter permease [Streptosporangiaceae bacterium]
MSTYLLRRAGTSVIIVIGISILVFGMLHLIGGAPGRAVLGLRASPASVFAWDKTHGFNRPIAIQYLTYMNQLIHGNLGQSYKLNQSVDQVLAEHAPISAYLSGLGLFFSIIIALPVGIYQAVKRNTLGDNVITAAAFVTYSMPVFLLGLLLIQIFAITLGIFPVGAPASVSQDSSVVGAILDPRAMVLPVATLTLISVAGYSRYMRSSALDALAQDYIKAARAKGLPERLVLIRHLVRNACLPMVTLIGLSIPLLLAGNLITENVFNYPGLGIMFIDALQQEDYPVLLAYTLMGGVLTVVGNYVADIALTVADPRIRLA